MRHLGLNSSTNGGVRSALRTFLLFFVIIFFANSFITEYTFYLDDDLIEQMEMGEEETESEKKENKEESELDDYIHALFKQKHYSNLITPSHQNEQLKWQSHSVEILTPPPELA